MRIKSLSLTDYPPIKLFDIPEAGNILIIAGANGAGKTRLKQAIVSTLQGQPLMNMTIEATRSEEETTKYFGGTSVQLEKGVPSQVLNNYINSRQYGFGQYVGSLVQIDSSRNVQAVNYSRVNWLAGDPDDSVGVGNFYFSQFSDRWQDFMNYIHQKSAARDKKIAEEMKSSPGKTGHEILSRNPNPLDKYKKIFQTTLPGKELLDIDPAQPREFRYHDSDGQELTFQSLSSGEQEVIKVLFDVARKDIRHSIIIVDEPELHLHPTLTYRLIESLKNIGENTNQFIFLTHSSDLITTYYSTGSVYFIDPSKSGENQARRMIDIRQQHHDLIGLIGQNLGLFAVGKILVFVEGEEASVDRLTYQKIANSQNPEIRIVPVGSVQNILALNNIENQIRNSIFGIQLYMIRDRDGLTPGQIAILEANRRVRCLRRRHIENYFLDPAVLFEVAESLYLTRTNPNLTVDSIRAGILEIANDSVGYNLSKNIKDIVAVNHFVKSPSVKDVGSKTVEEIKAEIVQSISENLAAISTSLSQDKLRQLLDSEERILLDSLKDGSWESILQGKYIFSRVCSNILKEDQIRVRHAYVDTAIKNNSPILNDLYAIFQDM